MKPYFADYASHCLSVYLFTTDIGGLNSIERRNWMCAETVLKGYTDAEIELLRKVFEKESPNFFSIARRIEQDEGLQKDSLTRMVSRVQYLIARERGLVK